ncbi:MAG: methyltransferase domain-containing protein [Flavobacteriales bacterium]|jgi:SAM-dependent methyltransferase|nr:methyltransferase domain-containing protein [Flavobacteriales bacterium]
MFFPERITRIEPVHRVLEIGPGADPHPRSDVLLEMAFDDPAEYGKQFGHDRVLSTDKQIVFYDGHRFPFKDAEFDYVICSHVLEHVPDVEAFLAEVFRVAKRGYFEYPLCYYEYLYNIGAHENYLKHDHGSFRYMKKSDTPLDAFKPVQAFFFETLNKGYTRTLNDLLPWVMEGFEWEQPFRAERVRNLESVCHVGTALPVAQEKPVYTLGPKRLLRELYRSMRYRHHY